jgi:hypothetical protein
MTDALERLSKNQVFKVVQTGKKNMACLAWRFGVVERPGRQTIHGHFDAIAIYRRDT